MPEKTFKHCHLTRQHALFDNYFASFVHILGGRSCNE